MISENVLREFANFRAFLDLDSNFFRKIVPTVEISEKCLLKKFLSALFW